MPLSQVLGYPMSYNILFLSASSSLYTVCRLFIVTAHARSAAFLGHRPIEMATATLVGSAPKLDIRPPSATLTTPPVFMLLVSASTSMLSH
jgi:hypothetical protein